MANQLYRQDKRAQVWQLGSTAGEDRPRIKKGFIRTHRTRKIHIIIIGFNRFEDQAHLAQRLQDFTIFSFNFANINSILSRFSKNIDKLSYNLLKLAIVLQKLGTGHRDFLRVSLVNLWFVYDSVKLLNGSKADVLPDMLWSSEFWKKPWVREKKKRKKNRFLLHSSACLWPCRWSRIVGVVSNAVSRSLLVC